MLDVRMCLAVVECSGVRACTSRLMQVLNDDDDDDRPPPVGLEAISDAIGSK